MSGRDWLEMIGVFLFALIINAAFWGLLCWIAAMIFVAVTR